jgi:hypothetical protein
MSGSDLKFALPFWLSKIFELGFKGEFSLVRAEFKALGLHGEVKIE